MRVTIHAITVALLIAGLLYHASPGRGEMGQVTVMIVLIKENQLVSADVENRSLSDLLRLMSGKGLFDIRGPIPSGEPLTMTFSNLTVSEALKKIMRGYNYVLLNQSPGGKPVLMVMGKTERSRAAEASSPAATPPAPANQAPEPGTYYVPPVVAEAPTPKPVPAPGSPADQQRFVVQPVRSAPGNRGLPSQQGSDGQGIGMAGERVVQDNAAKGDAREESARQTVDQSGQVIDRSPGSTANGGAENRRPQGDTP